VRLVVTLLFFLMTLPASAQWWSVQTSGMDTNLRGVSVTRLRGGRDEYIVWAAGSNGTILRSVDNGKNWERLTIPDARDLDFRDIQGFDGDKDTAYAMSSGDGEKSRVYKTSDGGKTWQLQYSDKRTGFFLDALACDSKAHCVVLSDPIEGKFVVIATNDGRHWSELSRDKIPVALPKEGAFAASGTSIALCSPNAILFATGGASVARVFRSLDGGRSWKAIETPVAAGGPTSGIFGIACEGSLVVAVGGDYKNADSSKQVAAFSEDLGETWQLADSQPGGYRSAVGNFGPGSLVAVGPNGTDIGKRQSKGEMRWQPSDKLNLNAVGFAGTEGWAVGPSGTIARFKAHSGLGEKDREPVKRPSAKN